MSYFTSADVTLSNKLLEVIYIIMGLLSIYAGIKNLRDKENPSRFGTAFFWCTLGAVIGFGRFIPPMVNGILVVAMTIPAIFKRVAKGKIEEVTEEQSLRMLERNGMKVFIPALTIGVCAIIFALFTEISALVGVGVGVILAVIMLMIMSNENKPMVFLKDSERLLSTVGPLCMLPMLLACLGAIFTAAGVGDVIAGYVGKIIPEGNVNIGIIIYALGMVLFTAIMGNAFAAITVMTVAIGQPFVLTLGANPVVIGMLALTTGFCGTLLTPMAANFNVVPVAMLDMKNRFGVIKNQLFIAVFMIVFQIAFMIAFK